MNRPEQTKSLANQLDSGYVAHRGALRWARTLSAAVAVGIALLWWFLASRTDPTIYNPGPVTLAHAQLEHNCIACHQPAPQQAAANGRGTRNGDAVTKAGFFRTVSDTACLRCHDGAIHHPKQADLLSPNGDRSSNCTTCHVEHKGHAQLGGISDEHCLRCHAQLNEHMKMGEEPVVQRSITRFALSAHPAFGSRLPHAADGSIVDPTRLKFNHRFHLQSTDLKDFPGDSACMRCHSTSQPNSMAFAPFARQGLPPVPAPTDPPLAWGNTRDRGYMQPVSYARHCSMCHELNLYPGGPAVAHTDLSLVRSQLVDVEGLLKQHVASQPKPAPAAAAAAQPALPGRRPARNTAAVTDPLSVAMASLDKQILTAEGNPRFDAIRAKFPNARPSTQESLLEFSVVFVGVGNNNSCILCHEVAGSLPAEVAAKADATPLTHTIPTSITNAPRHWYANSRFDHDAHRDQSCLSCHGSIRAVAPFPRTEAVLLAETARFNSPGIENCVRCHKPDDASERGAPADCVTCHVYHDRRLEAGVATPQAASRSLF